VTATSRVQRVAEGLIRASCRRLPDDERAERCREWSAELPAILQDETVRSPLMRSLRALSYSAGIAATTGRLRRAVRLSARAADSAWRDGAVKAQPGNLGLRATIGLASWLVIIFSSVSLLRASPHPHGWIVVLVLALAAAFAIFCLADVARAPAVRYLPKWAWALACVVQIPAGGIIYLSIGRVGRSRSLPPGTAQSP
jgi:hypothetical protein